LQFKYPAGNVSISVRKTHLITPSNIQIRPRPSSGVLRVVITALAAVQAQLMKYIAHSKRSLCCHCAVNSMPEPTSTPKFQSRNSPKLSTRTYGKLACILLLKL
jgi:hypothetical protein